MKSDENVGVVEGEHSKWNLSATQGTGRGILFIGPSPPPYNGMSVATDLVLAALRGTIPIAHLDTADRRGVSNIGKLDLKNLVLAARHGIENLWLLLKMRPRAVYVPISQDWLPYLRDCLFLIPARLTGRKIIIHLHGGYFGQFYKQSSRLMQIIIRYTLSKASVAIVLGRQVAGLFDGILPRERIRIIPNGIPDYFVGRVQAKSERSACTLLYMGTLDAQKGVLDLLSALSKVKKRVGRFQLIFAGGWYSQGDKEKADQIIRAANLAGDIEFLGPIGPEQKYSLLESVDFFVFPTKYRYEGHPYVILEAMAAGLPVISTTIACIPETIRDGVEGFLIEPADIDGLADRIELMIRDEKLRFQMAASARRRFLEEYTHEKFATRMREALKEALLD